MNRFDELAKALAGGLTRRQALRGIGGGLVGAVLAAVGLGKSWGKGTPNISSACQKYCTDAGTKGIKDPANCHGKCVSSCEACVHATGALPCGVNTPALG